MVRLIPRDEKFFDLFEEGAENVLKGAKLLAELFDNYNNVEIKIKQIKDVEHQGDEITHKTIEKLNKTFITPIDREDIHELISKVDDTLDFIDAVSNRMLLYKIDKPTPEVRALANILVKSVEGVTKAVNGLKNLKKPDEIINQCIEINRLENEGDSVLRDAVAKLFNTEKDPIQIIKWKEIYENLEIAIDKCEDVANIIEGVVLKNA